MKKLSKKFVALFLTLTLSLAFSITAFGAPSDIKSKDSTEFGRLTGTLEYAGKVYGRKNVNFWTDIQHISNIVSTTRIYASVDIHNYLTGQYLECDRAMVLENITQTGYYWEGHTALTNDNKLTAFGTHEARGSGSVVAYTDIHNF